MHIYRIFVTGSLAAAPLGAPLDALVIAPNEDRARLLAVLEMVATGDETASYFGDPIATRAVKLGDADPVDPNDLDDTRGIDPHVVSIGRQWIDHPGTR